MTTKNSPPRQLRAQADQMARTIKAALRGTGTPALLHRLREARERGFLKIGVVMDDKTVFIEMSFKQIEATTEQALAEYVFGLMQERRDATH